MPKKTKDSTADLILHPVRMRVLRLLGPGGHFTSQQLSEAMPDVPPATLYRHLNKLLKGDLLEVVSQRQVRGAQEKTLRLKGAGASLDPEHLASLSRADHLRYFTTFLASLIADYERYLQREAIDLSADGVGYRTVSLNLSDLEFLRLAHALQEVILPFVGLPASSERTIRHLSTVVIPDPPSPS